MTRIQLLVDDERERNAIQALLDQRYEILAGDQLQRADCYVVGDRTLPLYREELREHKAAEHPTFTPVLLIQRADTRLTTESDADSSEDQPLIDEVVAAPVEKPILYRRLDNLLVRRDQSLALTRQHEASVARFQALFDAIPDPAFVLDETGVVTEVNNAFCETLELDRPDMIGYSLGTIRGIGLDSEVLIDRVRSNGGTTSFGEETVELTDEGGNSIYTVLSVRNVDVEGTTCTVGILTDITDLKEKTERLEEFASVVAHDLRNPLQVAKTRLEIIEEECPSSREHTDSISVSLERINDLINKLLTVAKTGKTELQYDQVLLGTCVRAAWENVYTYDATLTTEDIDGVTIGGDENRLLELFENLFRNALEHVGESVSVRIGMLEDGFYIEDDGPGIPPEKQDDVLRMGYSTADGNGLGLNIVKEIVDAHNWELTITEGADGGARFEVHSIRELQKRAE